MKRRILAMFLAFVMVLGILPVQTFADETEPIEILESVVETTAPSLETEEVPPETEFPAEPSETFTEATELPSEETTATTEQTTASVVEVASAVEEEPEVTPADPVKVYVTVSNQGVLAQTQTGEIMFNKPVTVTDINKDGYLTYDEALSAAHDAYCPGGFSVSAGAATKLWGVTQTTNYLFFKNDVALTMGITVTDSSTVSEGDKLYASVNQDNTYWADWYTYFNKTAYTVDTNTDFTLNLQGYLGMEGGSTPEAVGGVSVGIWKNGAFEAIEGKTTDASGNVTLSFPEAGTYYVTASGTVSDEVVDWSYDAENPGVSTVTVDCPIMAPCCVVTVKAPLVGKVTVNATAQLGADFLVPPLIDEEVSGNLAESYGFTDRVPVANVSALDVLVKVHEEMFGEDFTADTASDYLVVGTSGWITTIFADNTASVAFLVNSDFPADAEGNGYCVDQAQVVSGDLVQFAYYEDTTAHSDACVWLELEDGTKLDGQSISAGSSVDVVVKKYASYGATDTVSVPGTAVYLVNTETGELTKLADTDDSGKATIVIPRDYANSIRYVTAYGTYTFMTLAKVCVGEALPQEAKLSQLQIAVGGGTMESATEQTLSPAFDGSVTQYTTPILDYVSSSDSRYVWVKASAEDAVITAKCGDSEVATVTSGEWTILQEAGGYWWNPTYTGCLKTGAYNEVTITVSVDGAEDKVYTVTVPMQPDLDNQSLAWKSNLKNAVYYTKNAEASLAVEAQYQNRPLESEDVIAYQWYSNTTGSTEGGAAITGAAAAVYAPSTAVAGTTYYYAVATCGELDPITSNVIAVTVTEEAAPTSVTLVCDYPYTVPDTWVKALGGVDYVATIGDELTIRAVDENGKDTPVAWSVSAYGGNFNQDTGKYTITGTSYTYLTAVSLYDSSITSGEKAICVKDYTIPSIRRNQSVALSTDGQTQNTAFVNGGVEGHTIWVNTIPKGVADCTTDLTQKGSSVYFNLLRPGIINVSYALDLGGEDDPVLGDSTTLTVTGVAVEDSQGKLGKTYLEMTQEQPNPTLQLTAYVAEGRTVQSWSSADDTIAAVDESGLVTAKGIGSVIITATDSEGTLGGIKVVVSDDRTPAFENIAFTTGGSGVKTQISFKPTTYAYEGVELYSATVDKLTLSADTLYNSEKLEAVASYTDVNGEEKTVAVASGTATTLPGIPFDETTVTITLTDKADAGKQTVYTFAVKRPRDTFKTINMYSGMALKAADGGALTTDQYQSKAEGYLFRADENGAILNTYSVYYLHYNYRAFLLNGRESFSIAPKSSAYAHLRYSVDDGATWIDLPQGGGTSGEIIFPEKTADQSGNSVVKVVLQVVSDAVYAESGNQYPETVTHGTNGTVYTIWVEQIPSADDVKMLSATTEFGDWYPAFAEDIGSYNICLPNGAEQTPVLTYTIAPGTKATIGEEVQSPNEDGSYTLALTTSAQKITVSSEDGMFTREYSFRYFERAENTADKVVDYLSVNSQYTNGAYGAPEGILGGSSLLSLGNFGGYVTFYFENGLTDDPRNQYGVDFYIDGNAFYDTSTGTHLGSMEPGQVWVSEDGSSWYALAGSEHYDADTLWDYAVTYSKNGDGTTWVDNYGNTDASTHGRSFSWPLATKYPLNELVKQNSFTLTGILIPSVKGITGDDDFGTLSSGGRFGYVDTLVNGTSNPYAENNAYQNKCSGFDLAWAVDAAGNPVDVSGMSFHYVKVVTASNIIAGAANEKSTEVSSISRAIAQAEAVGTTTAPTSITFTQGSRTKQLVLEAGKQIYEVELAMGQPSITVSAGEDDNIYINSQRVASGTASEGFAIEADSETLVRIIVQSGDQEPVIYLLKLKSAISFPGSGTEEDPYLLEDAAHLDNLNELVSEGETFEGTYFQITNDITVSNGWDGIGYARVEITNTWGSMIPSTKEFKPFMGTLDGQGYTVTFPAGSQPLFDCVRNATIKNIKIFGDIADDGLIANYAQDGYNKTADISGITVLSGTKIAGSGLLGGYASGSNVVNITDCHIEEGVTIGSAAASNIGGIAGDFNGTISDSSCAATVYGKDFVGGIVAGQGQSMSNTVISDCVFSGQVIASGNYVGGISGCGYTGTGWGFSPNAGCIDIKDCTVTGSITGGDYVGGILGAEPGVVQCWSNATGEITGNIFTGTISTAGQYVGGVIGYMKSINRYNIISGNRYQPTETVTKGIGGATYVDTSYANPTPVDGVTYVNSANGKTGIPGMSKTDHNRTDDPLGVDENELCLYDSTLKVDGGSEVVGGKSMTVRVVNSETGKALKTSEVVWSLASPDYAAYATVTASGKLNAYSVSTQHVVRLVGQLRGSYSGEIRHTVTIYPAATQVEIWNGEENVTGKTLCLNAAEGSRLDLTGKLYPTDAKEGISWKTSNAKIAAVTDGVVSYAGNSGTVTITATAQDGSGKNATVKIQVGILTTDVKIVEPASTTLRSGASVTLSAVTTPEKPTVSGVTFSLVNAADSAYATVSSSGKVTAKTVNEPHAVQIKATSKDAAQTSDIITLTILPKSEQMLILKSGETYVTGTTLVGNVGDTIALSASALNTEAEPKEEAQTVTWKSSNEKVATVVNGIVNCVKTGTVKITATTQDGSVATVSIKVTNLVQSITIEAKSATDDFVIASGKSVALKATVLLANASNKKVTWSITSGADYAKISSSGVLTANKDLTSTVTVTVMATAQDGSGVSNEQTVTVKPLAQGVRILRDANGNKEPTNTTLVWDMAQDTQLSLYARVYPKTADDSVTWKSSSTKIASIDANGTVTCHKAGTVTITATANDGSGKKASFKLSVVKLMKELKLEGGVIAGGKSLTLKPVITPADTTNKKLTWSISENTVGAKISSSGKLTTKAVSQPATVTITAEAQDGSGLTVSCDVTIYPATTKVVITGENGAAVPGTLAAGAELKLAAASTPANAANVYTWKSSNQYVTVTDGTVVASEGAVGKTVTITCVAADGTNKSASVKIKIVAATEG